MASPEHLALAASVHAHSYSAHNPFAAKMDFGVGKFFFIVSKFNGLVLDIEGCSDDHGTP